MFEMQVRFMAGGKQVGFDGFMVAVVAEIARRVRTEIQNLPQAPPVVVERSWRAPEEDRKHPRALAVGVSEAAKLLGVSVYTIRNYVAQRRIRSVRVGRRVLVPLEVLEKVAVEGVPRAGR